MHVRDWAHIMFAPYLFALPAAAQAPSFRHLCMGKNAVLLETKTHTGESTPGIFTFHFTTC